VKYWMQKLFPKANGINGLNTKKKKTERKRKNRENVQREILGNKRWLK
jgi:hypothetical protein